MGLDKDESRDKSTVTTSVILRSGGVDMDFSGLAEEVLTKAIADLNLSLPPGQKIENSPDAPLFGEGGNLDSMGFVDLAVCIQEAVFDKQGVAITVADETMLSGGNPFSTVRTLTQHVAKLIENAHRS